MEESRAAPELQEPLEEIEAALIESVARQEREVLNPVEQARAFATLKEQRGLTLQQLGDLVGCHKAKAANVMRLLKLPEEILELVAAGELTEAHGRSLLIAKDPEIRLELGHMAVEEGWSTTELTERAHESNGDAPHPSKDPSTPRRRSRKEKAQEQAQSPDASTIQQARTIAWTTALGAITAEALAERDRLSADVAREKLDELVGLELLERHSVLVGHPDLYTATVAGRRVARKHADAGGYTYPEGLRTARVTIREARHMIACASVAAALERRYDDHRVIGERELHRDERKARRRLASVDIRRNGRSGSHFPDLVVWPPGTLDDPDTPPSPTSAPAPSALPIAVEVELTLKSTQELIAILSAWADCRYIEAAIYFAETLKLEERLLDLIEELEIEDWVVVNPLSEVVKELAGFELEDGLEPADHAE
jgi:ParB-like chromosome segregation protein Spo0J